MRCLLPSIFFSLAACGSGVSLPDASWSTSEQSPVTGIEPRSALEQAALAGETVLEPPQVRLTDAAGEPLAGAVVRFSVEEGGGSVEPDTVVADENGFAQVTRWQLGKRAVANRLRAHVEGNDAISPVDFTASVGTDYTIVLHYLTDVTDRQRDVFSRAAARWEAVIIGELPDVTVARSTLSPSCGGGADETQFAIDDLLIFVRVQDIDGVGGKLASAGPCIIRSSDGSPAVGVMNFDAADLDFLETKNLLDTTILHEMGHVVGVGSLWPRRALVEEPSLPSSPGAATTFIGRLAGEAFREAAHEAYDTLAPVPVENSATAGSADAHWRESVFAGELMSPTLGTGDTDAPLSAITIASLQDLGSYELNTAAADAFTIAAPRNVAFARSAAPESSCEVLTPSQIVSD